MKSQTEGKKDYLLTSYHIQGFPTGRDIQVSFQKFTNKYCCFLGDGKVEGLLGWGKTKDEAVDDLVKNQNNYGDERSGVLPNGSYTSLKGKDFYNFIEDNNLLVK